tara:strand:+ start:2245 stop:2397 length:153 start_codon:yes stop_codon:yes gene_type:complete
MDYVLPNETDWLRELDERVELEATKQDPELESTWEMELAIIELERMLASV